MPFIAKNTTRLRIDGDEYKKFVARLREIHYGVIQETEFERILTDKFPQVIDYEIILGIAIEFLVPNEAEMFGLVFNVKEFLA